MFMDPTDRPSHCLEDIDWANFHFPTRPGTRSTKELLTGGGRVENPGAGLDGASAAQAGHGHGMGYNMGRGAEQGGGGSTRAPTWAVPPTRIDSWHLDAERWLLSHPGQRKKVELLRLTTRRRLAMVVDLIAFQPTDVDQAALWRGLNNAIYMAFGVGLGEMLVSGPDSWEWPMSIAQGGRKEGAAGRGNDGPGDSEENLQRRRMGLNGF